MPDKPTDATVSHQVELVIRRLDSLSILPSASTQCLSRLLQLQSRPPELAGIIESSPALTAKILSLMGREGLSFTDEQFSIRNAVDKLGPHIVREAFFSMKVYPGFERDEQRILLRKELIRHCLGVACCAKDIAEIISVQMYPELAYTAGLLHDIGKFALDEAMPRSFTGIVEQAKSQKSCVCAIEQKNLGTDHTILGKRLAAKWRLPSQITLAIWLHHSNTEIISEDMPEARIAEVIQLADLIVRQCGIGWSGSYDSVDSAKAISKSLGINQEQLEQIRRNLAEKVAQKSEVLGLDLSNASNKYYDIVQTAAAQLGREHTKLSLENRRLQSASSHFDFMTDFLSSINSNTAPIDAAESFAVRWQKFYQTGPVCVYLAAGAEAEFLEAVVVESPHRSKTVILNAPSGTSAIPEAIAKKFGIINAGDYADWLFEQLDMDFDLSETKMAPLLCGGRALGAIVFESRYPVETEQIEEKFKAAASIAGAVLDMAFADAVQQRFAEQFAHLVSRLGELQQRISTGTLSEEAQPQISTGDYLMALAEMAGGAAHELNNPLSVISGRAQLLADSETDAEKKRILKQIQESTKAISAIIDDLMSFARPPQPRRAPTDIKQMLEEAIQLTAQKQKSEQLDISIDVADGLGRVFVDSGQIVSATANIFCNCLESYPGGFGPIKVAATGAESGDFVKLAIIDFGCGMDSGTLQKATQPFFSARPAGRKRGMGLSHAGRLIQLNGGCLNITSQLGTGTTATILLPCK